MDTVDITSSGQMHRTKAKCVLKISRSEDVKTRKKCQERNASEENQLTKHDNLIISQKKYFTQFFSRPLLVYSKCCRLKSPFVVRNIMSYNEIWRIHYVVITALSVSPSITSFFHPDILILASFFAYL